MRVALLVDSLDQATARGRLSRRVLAALRREHEVVALPVRPGSAADGALTSVGCVPARWGGAGSGDANSALAAVDPAPGTPVDGEVALALATAAQGAEVVVSDVVWAARLLLLDDRPVVAVANPDDLPAWGPGGPATVVVTAPDAAPSGLTDATTPWTLPGPVVDLPTSDVRADLVLVGTLHAGVEAFVDELIDVARSRPDLVVRAYADPGGAPARLRRRLDAHGMHGLVTVEDRATYENRAPASPAVVVAVRPGDDHEATVAEAAANGAVVALLHPDGRLTVPGPGGLEYPVGLDELLSTPAATHRSAPPDPTAAWTEMLQQVVAGGSSALEERVDALLHGVGSVAPIGAAEVTAPAESAPGPAQVRWRGHLCDVDDHLTEAEAIAQNRAWTCAALDAHGVTYVQAARNAEPGQVIVDADDLPTALAAVRAAAKRDERPWYVAAPGLTGGRVLARHLPADVTPARVRVYRSVVPESRTLHHDHGAGCAVEPWSWDDELAAYTGPSTTRWGPRLPTLVPDLRVSDAHGEHATQEVFTRPLLDEVDFPIDAVWTWVDGEDPHWRAQRDALDRTSRLASGAEADARYSNRDELRHSLRSVAMYAPWIRHLYLVTADQVPDWLDTAHPRITVVPHREIFTDPGNLPTFNSHAIESQLHHIDGLAEHFLYFNDDVFLGRRVAPEVFFTPEGQPRTFPSPLGIPPTPIMPSDSGFYASRKNNRRIIEERFGRVLVHGYLHTTHSLRRSTLAEMEEELAEEWKRTASARFRTLDELAVVSSLHHDWARLTGRAVPGTLRSRYVKASRRESLPLMRDLLTRRDLDVLCLNDTIDGDLPAAEQDLAMRAFMSAYFPVAAPWEIDR